MDRTATTEMGSFGRRRLVSLAAGASQALGETRDACPLPKFTEIFFHKNVTDVFTPTPAKRLHYQLRPWLDMGIKHRSLAKNELHGFSFIGAVWPRKIREIFARRDPFVRVE
jgi:hypothetical protein